MEPNVLGLPCSPSSHPGHTYFNLHHVRREIRRLRAAGVDRVCLLSCKLSLDVGTSFGDGHAVRQLLLRTGALFQTSLRANDFVARVAEDEFVVVVADADEPAGQRVADRLRERAALLNLESGPPLLHLHIDVFAGPPVVKRLCRFLEGNELPTAHQEARATQPD